MTKCCSDFPDHSKETKRLNRASGQIEGVKRMIDERNYCPDIIAQLRAVRSAVKAVEANILARHLESCVRQSMESNNEKDSQEKIEELIQLFKRY